ncbi:MAG: exodeoxyribonuclease VII large subunit, partial [Succinivibrio sp.]
VRITDKCLRGLGVARVAGEISELKPYCHLYFTLKDEESSVDCLMWSSSYGALPFKPEVGMQVVVTGQSSLYSKNGSFKLIASSMEQAGFGAIMERLRKLKEQLEREGVFAQNKRPLPPFPRRLGVVTSKDGEAVHDIITTACSRFPGLEIRIYPARVQGPGAPRTLIEALELAWQEDCCDVLIIGRGGGSFDDLLAFSDEAVVRAVASSPIPIISAVGHEPDVALTDFAADVRAATPTRAAELVTPVTRADLMDALGAAVQRMDNAQGRILDSASMRLDSLKSRLEAAGPAATAAQARARIGAAVAALDLASSRIIAERYRRISDLRAALSALDPQRAIESTRARLADLGARADRACLEALDKARGRIFSSSHALMSGRGSRALPEAGARFAADAARLEALSPLKVLARGYSVSLGPGGKAVTSPDEVASGDEMTTILAGGKVVSRVERAFSKEE